MKSGKLAIVGGNVVQIGQIFSNTNQVLVFNIVTRRYELHDTEQLNVLDQPLPFDDQQTKDVLIVDDDGESNRRAQLKRGRSADDLVVEVVVAGESDVKKVDAKTVVPDFSRLPALPVEVIVLILSSLETEALVLNFVSVYGGTSKLMQRNLSNDRVWKYITERFKKTDLYRCLDYDTNELHKNVIRMLDHYTVDKQKTFVIDRDTGEKTPRNVYKRFFEFLHKYRIQDLQNQLQWQSREVDVSKTVYKNSDGNIKTLTGAFQCGNNVFFVYTKNKAMIADRNPRPVGNFIFKTSNESPLLGDKTNIQRSDVIFWDKYSLVEVICYDQSGFVFMYLPAGMVNDVYFRYYDSKLEKIQDIFTVQIDHNMSLTAPDVKRLHENVRGLMNKTTIAIEVERTLYLFLRSNFTKLKEAVLHSAKRAAIHDTKSISYWTYHYSYIDTIEENGVITTFARSTDPWHQPQLRFPLIIDSMGAVVRFETVDPYRIIRKTLFTRWEEQKTGIDLVSCRMCGMGAQNMCNTCQEPFCSQKCFKNTEHRLNFH